MKGEHAVGDRMNQGDHHDEPGPRIACVLDNRHRDRDGVGKVRRLNAGLGQSLSALQRAGTLQDRRQPEGPARLKDGQDAGLVISGVYDQLRPAQDVEPGKDPLLVPLRLRRHGTRAYLKLL
jgi:hypothetical protein